MEIHDHKQQCKHQLTQQHLHLHLHLRTQFTPLGPNPATLQRRHKDQFLYRHRAPHHYRRNSPISSSPSAFSKILLLPAVLKEMSSVRFCMAARSWCADNFRGWQLFIGRRLYTVYPIFVVARCCHTEVSSQQRIAFKICPPRRSRCFSDAQIWRVSVRMDLSRAMLSTWLYIRIIIICQTLILQ